MSAVGFCGMLPVNMLQGKVCSMRLQVACLFGAPLRSCAVLIVPLVPCHEAAIKARGEGVKKKLEAWRNPLCLINALSDTLLNRCIECATYSLTLA